MIRPVFLTFAFMLAAMPAARLTATPTYGTHDRERPAIVALAVDDGPGAWRDSRAAVTIALAVGALQTLLIVGLLVERKRRLAAEREARRHLTTAAHLDRRAVAGELAAALSHQLNQPLGAIIHNAEAAELMLDNGSLTPEDLRGILADIRKDDTRAGEIMRRMRGLLRKHELTMVPVDLNEVAVDTAEMIGPEAAARGALLELRLSRALPNAAGDRIHLQQVLLNLLLNSLQAVAGEPASRRQVLLETARRDGHVDVAISDTGPGFVPDKLPRVFEPFFTTRGDGLGVGLSIARTIVEAHGGHISAENNTFGGATVRFSLPARDVPSS